MSAEARRAEFLENFMLIGCADCDTPTTGDIHHNAEGLTVCPSCATNYKKCHSSGQVFKVTDMIFVEELGKFYSKRAADLLFVESAISGDRILRETAFGWYDAELRADKFYTQEEKEDNFFHCDNTGEMFPLEQSVSYDDYLFSYAGYGNHRDVLRSYSSHADREDDLEFLKLRHENTTYMGIELEVNRGDGSKPLNYLAAKAQDILGDYFMMKEDSSISDGFEIVSHPMTYGWIKKNIDVKAAFEELKEIGLEEDNSCGMHVHVNRDAATNTTWWKVALMVSKCCVPITTFTRREISDLNDWASIPRKHKLMDRMLSGRLRRNMTLEGEEGRGRRYCAINTTNENTYEFRMFSTTLDHNTFKATLQFVNAILEFAAGVGVAYLMTSRDAKVWSDFKAYAEKNKYSLLVNYLNENNI